MLAWGDSVLIIVGLTLVAFLFSGWLSSWIHEAIIIVHIIKFLWLQYKNIHYHAYI